MPAVKIVVIYPRPVDEQKFEREYKEKHMPMVEQKLKGLTRFVASRVLESPQGRVTAYRIAEVHFPGMDELRKCIESDGGREVVEHARQISTGGEPLMLICDEESFVYW